MVAGGSPVRTVFTVKVLPRGSPIRTTPSVAVAYRDSVPASGFPVWAVHISTVSLCRKSWLRKKRVPISACPPLSRVMRAPSGSRYPDSGGDDCLGSAHAAPACSGTCSSTFLGGEPPAAA